MTIDSMFSRLVGLCLVSVFHLTVLAAPEDTLQIEYWPDRRVSVEAGEPSIESAIGKIREHMHPTHFIPESPIKPGMRHPGARKAFVLVAHSSDIPDTLVVLFNYKRFMNAALTRASVFSENVVQLKGKRGLNHPAGIITDYSELTRLNVFNAIAGHDLTGQHLLAFWKALDQVSPRYQSVGSKRSGESLLRIEQEFRRFLEPIIQQNPRLALAVVAVDTTYIDTLSHELSHAQYFNSPAYREAIQSFWDQHVTASDREAVAKTLQDSGFYNPTGNQGLVINEFQAYLTQLRADIFPLARFADPYSWMLRSFLMQRFPTARLVRMHNPHKIALSPYCRSYLLVRSCEAAFKSAPACAL